MDYYINGRKIGEEEPCFIVCEISANHNQRLDFAVELVKQAKAAGADAIKVQLYLPGEITLPLETSDFQITTGLWKGVSLYTLYSHTYMPWEWYPDLLQLADLIGITLFPTVSDLTALEFAERHNTPAYKIASFEIGDRRLLKAVASTGKPMIVSMGCATQDDREFIQTRLPNERVILLHCVSDYPADVHEEDLDAACFEMDGISDHTSGIGFALLCAYAGATMIEKHMWLGTGECPDQEFSITPSEFKTMADAIRAVEGTERKFEKNRGRTPEPKLNLRRSIYVARDVKKGDVLDEHNIRVVRPGYGMNPRLYEGVLGKIAAIDMPMGTALKENYYR